MNWQGLDHRVNDDRLIARFARGADYRVLIRSGTEERVIQVRDGRLVAITTGPFVMPQCDFALSGDTNAWARFAAARPAPGDQDIFAFFRRGEITLTGDTRKFYAHQLSLKLILQRLRTQAGAA